MKKWFSLFSVGSQKYAHVERKLNTLIKRRFPQFRQLEKRFQEKGFLTKDDVFALSYPSWAKHLILFLMKRNPQLIHYYYASYNLKGYNANLAQDKRGYRQTMQLRFEPRKKKD